MAYFVYLCSLSGKSKSDLSVASSPDFVQYTLERQSDSVLWLPVSACKHQSALLPFAYSTFQ